MRSSERRPGVIHAACSADSAASMAATGPASLSLGVRLRYALSMKRTILAILTVGFLSVWLLSADRYFDSSPDGLVLLHEPGLAASVEQFGAALYAPAYIAWLGYIHIGPSMNTIDRSPLFLLCVLQLWPLAVFVFRPWPRLSRPMRGTIIGYAAACGILTVCGFLFLRQLSSAFTI